MLNQQLTQILSDFRQAFSQLYGDRLAGLYLFGSQARGDAGQDSDIDVLVVLQGLVDDYQEIERTGAIISALSLQYDTLLLCVFVSEQDYRTKNLPLLQTVRCEGIAV